MCFSFEKWKAQVLFSGFEQKFLNFPPEKTANPSQSTLKIFPEFIAMGGCAALSKVEV